MRRVRPLFASLAVVAVVAAGCTDTAEPIEPTASPPSSTQPAVEPPELPDLAKQESAEGASTFVDYYLEVLTYAAQTGDTQPLVAASDPSCAGCQDYVDHFNSRAEAGGWTTGGGFSAGEISITSHGNDVAMVTEITIEAGRALDDADADEYEFEATSEIVTFVASYQNGSWSMTQFVPGDHA